MEKLSNDVSQSVPESVIEEARRLVKTLGTHRAFFVDCRGSNQRYAFVGLNNAENQRVIDALSDGTAIPQHFDFSGEMPSVYGEKVGEAEFEQVPHAIFKIVERIGA